jgi:hypothetical protein
MLRQQAARAASRSTAAGLCERRCVSKLQLLYLGPCCSLHLAAAAGRAAQRSTAKMTFGCAISVGAKRPI